MIRDVCFALSKHPKERGGGDVVVSSLVMQLAAESFSVSAIALADRDENLNSRDGIVGVRKGTVRKADVVFNALYKRRSSIHTRFDNANLRCAIEKQDADIFVAEHSYMAESLLATDNAGDKVWINTHVAESDVIRSTPGIRKLEATRIFRDELRTGRAAKSVGCFDTSELDRYRHYGVTHSRLLEVGFEPHSNTNMADTDQNLLFIGDQTWLPNREAVENLLKIWPIVHKRVPSATLSIVGRKPKAPYASNMEGVTVYGFVDDLDHHLEAARALVAPVTIGGGVRVKILETSARGIPVVATPEAVGALSSQLGLNGFSDRDSFVDECVHLLLDKQYSVSVGSDLYDRNRDNWVQRRPHKSVSDWLVGARKDVS